MKRTAEPQGIDSTVVEQVLAKALYLFLDTVKPKGLAVFHDDTDTKYCIFVDTDGVMRCQQSDTIEYDLTICDVVQEADIH